LTAISDVADRSLSEEHGRRAAADKPLVMAPAAALPCGEAGLYVLERHTTSHSQ